MPLRPFYIDVTTVANASFETIVEVTGYRTDAERFGWSLMLHTHLPTKFANRLQQTHAVQELTWWIAQG